ncbi:patatin-like phospholipase family protein [Paraburkholderia dipogonis]|uniref:patatin-like phospholipase family protein n=1 Tax=Paraburkholderia dipogonis TaxID=1211383 RepID=UPI0038B9D3D3
MNLQEALPETRVQSSAGIGRPIYLAFQGGGARGIAHVGGLAAVNHLGLPIAGVAGTSAGALMAALVAANYSAGQLLEPNAGTHLLEKVAEGRFGKATDLFGRDWKSIKLLRWTMAACGKICKYYRSTQLSDDLAWLWKRKWGKGVVILTGMTLAFQFDKHVPGPAFAVLVVLLVAVVWAAVLCVDGLAALDEVRMLVDEAIAEGLKVKARNITFQQLHDHGGLPLKLVATNIDTQSLELFSLDATPSAVVADAVAASICLPVAFKPWSFRYARRGEDAPVERRFIDGGILSNLPVWTFDEERALFPDAVTVAFGLEPQKSSDGPPHWLPAALHAVVAGPPEVHFRGIERLIHIALACELNVLDFDANLEQLGKNVSKAKERALKHLELNLTEVPRAIRATLLDLQEELTKDLRDGFPDDFTLADPAEPLVRIALAIQKPTERISLGIAHEVGHSESKWGKRFPLQSSPVGTAWFRRTGFYISGAGNDEARFYRDTKWTGLFAIADDLDELGQEEDEVSASELAVVAIVDSAVPLPDTIMLDEARLEQFWVTLEDTAFRFFGENHVGRLFRRSIAWL